MIFEQINSLNKNTSYFQYLINSRKIYTVSGVSILNSPNELKKFNTEKSSVIYLNNSHAVEEWVGELSKHKTILRQQNIQIWISLKPEDIISELDGGDIFTRFETLGTKLNFHLRLEGNSVGESWSDHIERISSVLQHIDNKPQVFCSYELNETSGTWADDVFQKLTQEQRLRVFFYPAKQFLHNPSQLGPSKFHVLMFLEGQMKAPGLPLAFRLYHNRWAKQMQSLSLHGEESFMPHEIIIRYYPDRNEWNSSLRALIKGKLAGWRKRQHAIVHSGAPKPEEISNPSDWKKVLITGWYGTETNGDKAILGEVLHFLKSQSPHCKIVLTSIYMPVSHQTNEELEDLKGVELISIYEKNLDPIIKDCDAVIMGGGPMMETALMENVQRIFESGNRLGKARIIFGCGVGPFHGPRYENMTRRCIELCTAGFFRDKESWEYANRLVPGNSLKFACDPAVGFIHRWRKNNLQKFTKTQPGLLVSLLRANTNEFAQEMQAEQLRSKNEEAAVVLSALIEPTVQNNGLHVELLHMNTPWVGGDDRLFNRMVEHSMKSVDAIHAVREYYTLEQHLEVMAKADLSVAMRYHGHIFSMALGIPFVSIDYTGKKGKVSSLVKRIHYADYSIIWEEMDSDANKNLLQKVWNQKEELSKQLIEETENLVSLLHKTYKEVFNSTR